MLHRKATLILECFFIFNEIEYKKTAIIAMPFEIFSLWSKTQIGHKKMSRHFFDVPFHSEVKGEIYI